MANNSLYHFASGGEDRSSKCLHEVMSLIKDTSLVYALGISDLILASRTAANRDASLAPMFLAGACRFNFHWDRDHHCLSELKELSYYK